MNTIELQQGSAEWHAHRAGCYNASDAPAMLGCSPYVSRADLIARIATGIEKEVDSATQKRFDDGHRFEALARPLAEKIIGEELYPVTGTADFGLARLLSASFDGLTMLEDTASEHKSLNDEIRAALPSIGMNEGVTLPKLYRVQMEQQMMVSGAERVLFMASKWEQREGEWVCVEERHCWYFPDEALRAEILAGWKQLEADVAAYAPAEVIPAVEAAPVRELPTLFVQARGEVTNTNLPDFKRQITDFLETLNLKPETDQEFADSKALAPKLRELAVKIQERKADMLAQTVTIGEVATEIDYLTKVINAKALELEKAVEREEKARKAAITQTGKDGLKAYIDGLNALIAQRGVAMPAITADFDEAIKGKRLLSKMQEAVDTLLAQKKIEASTIYDAIKFNLTTYEEIGAEYPALFPDLRTIVLKGTDDFTSTVKLRISEHKEAERLRAEKADREAAEAAAAAQRDADAAEARRQQQAGEEAAKVIEQDRQADSVAMTPPASIPAEQIPAGNVTRISAARFSDQRQSNDDLIAQINRDLLKMDRKTLNLVAMFCKEKIAA